jgi:hypothetical protein
MVACLSPFVVVMAAHAASDDSGADDGGADDSGADGRAADDGDGFPDGLAAFPDAVFFDSSGPDTTPDVATTVDAAFSVPDSAPIAVVDAGQTPETPADAPVIVDASPATPDVAVGVPDGPRSSDTAAVPDVGATPDARIVVDVALAVDTSIASDGAGDASAGDARGDGGGNASAGDARGDGGGDAGPPPKLVADGSTQDWVKDAKGCSVGSFGGGRRPGLGTLALLAGACLWMIRRRRSR